MKLELLDNKVGNPARSVKCRRSHRLLKFVLGRIHRGISSVRLQKKGRSVDNECASTLSPETVMGEFPTVEVPVKAGTVFVVSLSVTVCAATPEDIGIKTNPCQILTYFFIVSIPSTPIVRLFPSLQRELQRVNFSAQ